MATSVRKPLNAVPAATMSPSGWIATALAKLPNGPTFVLTTPAGPNVASIRPSVSVRIRVNSSRPFLTA